MEISFEKLPQAVNIINERLQNIERLLLERVIQPDSEIDELLNIKQAAKHLDVTVQTMYGYVHDREIPFSKKRKRLYFSKKELTDWTKTGRKKTVAETNASAEESIIIRRKKK
jgi:excisionase family DNA binding protein